MTQAIEDKGDSAFRRRSPNESQKDLLSVLGQGRRCLRDGAETEKRKKGVRVLRTRWRSRAGRCACGCVRGNGRPGRLALEREYAGGGSRSRKRRNAGTAEPVRKRHEGLRRDPARPKRQRKNREWVGGAEKLRVEEERWRMSTEASCRASREWRKFRRFLTQKRTRNDHSKNQRGKWLAERLELWLRAVSEYVSSGADRSPEVDNDDVPDEEVYPDEETAIISALN
ncbi:hypothetical protein C8R45DRAFT_1149150 [Mycena sanguinolenta]|nr:hypothetical protein C8R45DRAFT_1149150 [Mycena sanguinolenta]